VTLGGSAVGAIRSTPADVAHQLPARLNATRLAARRGAAPGAQEQVGVALPVDLRRSVVRWRGTKFRGRGKHEGTVHLAAGALALCGARVCGGRFALDMRSIAVTDIPAHETEARARLTTHLKSPDFFWTERHPTATFVLRQVTPVAGATHRVSGELTLRGVMRPISFVATLDERAGGERRVDARLRLDRQDWGIRYRYDPIRNEIVDDDIALELELVFPAAPGAVHS
jgi:polyisoprenoid-binding protein YceI